MAEVHHASLTPGKLDLLQDWISHQRWYAAKGKTPRLRRVWSWRLDDPVGEVGIETLLVVDESGTEPVLYQVPLTYRGAPLAGAEHALLGTTEHSVLGRRWVYDGPHDPVYAEQLLELAQGRAVPQAGSSSDTPEPAVVGTRHPSWTARTTVRGARVLSGEQSNTSVIYDCVDESGSSKPLICKVFRTLQAGPNPDVVVQGALVEAGSARVPGMVGSVAATWPSPTEGAPAAYGHLAFAQEFLPGTEDAWRVALRAVAAGESFAAQAHELGEATAEVHAVLARALPTQPASEEAVAQTVAGMRLRYAAAASEVPAIAAYDHEITDVFERAAAAPWPALQRIHGDYHLGQVLHSPGRGWVLLDFEGEPLRPLVERSRPDLTVRDVAGMLRSFDYAAGSWEQSHPEQSAREWVEQAQSAFLDGYAAAAGRDPRADHALLVALQLDKALYEVVYEARNRPSWLSIPTDAVVRLLDQLKEGDTMTPNLPQHGDQEQQPTAPAAGADVAGHGAPVVPDPTHAIEALAAGRHQQPHDLLGQHVEPGGLRVRAFRKFAHSVTARFEDGQRLSLQHEAHGVWSGVRAGAGRTMDYRLLVDYGDGVEHEHDDPYRFAPTLGDVDRHLIGEGRHEQLWTVLGAHVHEYDGPIGTVRGTAFAVWAPHARAVHVTGDFNGWDETSHPMRLLGESGVWELFIPGIAEGTRYKFAIRGSDDQVRSKADPMAQATETPPATASVVTRSQYEWNDDEWLRRRAETDAHTGPMSVYEVHLGSWRSGLGYRDLAEHLVNYVADLGFTHVELLPVMEHPYGPSWGYQVTGYFAPTARFGSPDEFRHLVDRLHQAGIGVILDWVPAHFPRDAWALAKFDGQALYEHPDPRRGDQPDWGTHIFDFGRIQVRNFLVANAIYWLEEFHIDGLRVDAVASMLYLDYSRQEGQWLPNQYGGRENLEAIGLLQETNATTYKRVPGIVTVAEESTSWPGVTKPTDAGGLGFGLKWNMGWMNDTLRYLSQEPIHRQYHHNLLTFSLMYAYSENYLLPISHDEVVHGKGSLLRKIPGSRYDQLATLRAYFAYIWSHPGKQLIFMGSEFAQEAEWADGRELDWWLLDHAAHYRVHNLVKELNALYRRTPALWALDSSPAGFEWLNANDNAGNTFSYLRFGGEDHGSAPVVAVVVNFSGTAREGLRIGLPRGGQWRVVLDTSGFDEFGTPSQADVVLTAQERPWDDQPYSVEVVVAKLSAIYLAPVESDQPAALSAGAGRG